MASLARHGVMIVGQTGSGKSVTWRMLKKTLTRLHKEKKGSEYQIVRVSPIMKLDDPHCIPNGLNLSHFFSTGLPH